MMRCPTQDGGLSKDTKNYILYLTCAQNGGNSRNNPSLSTRHSWSNYICELLLYVEAQHSRGLCRVLPVCTHK